MECRAKPRHHLLHLATIFGVYMKLSHAPLWRSENTGAKSSACHQVHEVIGRTLSTGRMDSLHTNCVQVDSHPNCVECSCCARLGFLMDWLTSPLSKLPSACKQKNSLGSSCCVYCTPGQVEVCHVYFSLT